MRVSVQRIVQNLPTDMCPELCTALTAAVSSDRRNRPPLVDIKNALEAEMARCTLQIMETPPAQPQVSRRRSDGLSAEQRHSDTPRTQSQRMQSQRAQSTTEDARGAIASM